MIGQWISIFFSVVPAEESDLKFSYSRQQKQVFFSRGEDISGFIFKISEDGDIQ